MASIQAQQAAAGKPVTLSATAVAAQAKASGGTTAATTVSAPTATKVSSPSSNGGGFTDVNGNSYSTQAAANTASNPVKSGSSTNTPAATNQPATFDPNKATGTYTPFVPTNPNSTIQGTNNADFGKIDTSKINPANFDYGQKAEVSGFNQQERNQELGAYFAGQPGATVDSIKAALSKNADYAAMTDMQKQNTAADVFAKMGQYNQNAQGAEGTTNVGPTPGQQITQGMNGDQITAAEIQATNETTKEIGNETQLENMKNDIINKQNEMANAQGQQQLDKAGEQLNNMKQAIAYIGQGGNVGISSVHLDAIQKQVDSAQSTYNNLVKLQADQKDLQGMNATYNATAFSQQIAGLQDKLNQQVNPLVQDCINQLEHASSSGTIDNMDDFNKVKGEISTTLDAGIANFAKTNQAERAQVLNWWNNSVQIQQDQIKAANTVNEALSKNTGYVMDGNGNKMLVDGKPIAYVGDTHTSFDAATGNLIQYNDAGQFSVHQVDQGKNSVPTIANQLAITEAANKGKITHAQAAAMLGGDVTVGQVMGPTQGSSGGGGTVSKGTTTTKSGITVDKNVSSVMNATSGLAYDARAILEGRMSLQSISANLGRSKEGMAKKQQIIDNVASIDPNFDFAASDAGVKSVSTAYVQKAKIALNTVTPNIDTIIQLSNQVGRVGVKGIDAMIQNGQVQFGNAKVTSLHEAQKLVSDELGVALGGGTMSDMKLQLGMDIVDPSLSADVFASNMKLVKGFLENRTKALDGLRYSSPTVANAPGAINPAPTALNTATTPTPTTATPTTKLSNLSKYSRAKK